MNKGILKRMKNQLSNDFSEMNEDSLILVLGGAKLATSGCTGSGNECDHTTVCCLPTKPQKPIKKGEKDVTCVGGVTYL